MDYGKKTLRELRQLHAEHKTEMIKINFEIKSRMFPIKKIESNYKGNKK